MTFKCSSTRGRNLKKRTTKSSKESEEENEIVRMIACKTLHIKLYDNQGRPRKELGLELEKLLLDFRDRPDISK